MSEQWQSEESRGRSQAQPPSRTRGNQGEMIWQNRLQTMMQQAEQNLPDGALTAGYKADPQEIVALLIRAQAGEWASFLQYWHHYFMASDIHSAEVKEVFKEHAEDEYEHARMFGERIQQLGGVPCDKPEDIARLTPTPTEYNHDLRSMMEADLVGERQTIDFYDEIIRTCGFDDNVTRKIMEHIVEEEAGHADDWATLLYAYDGSTGKQIESIHDQISSLLQARAQQPKMARRVS
jgi:bacterioferritin